jgi:arabinan endo-1,5-alpha-L-arabinosidase
MLRLLILPASRKEEGLEVKKPVASSIVKLARSSGAQLWCWAVLMVFVGAGRAAAQIALHGDDFVHDPSPMNKCDGRYYIYFTGQDIPSISSPDKINWVAGPSVFNATNAPLWTTNAVPGFTGLFWAPDVISLNGGYYLYYAVSTFGSQVSAIGVATNSTLDPTAPGYQWADQGPVIESGESVDYNAIDPSALLLTNGQLWMTFGSFWSGIKMIQLDPATGKRISANSTVYSLATHPPSTAIEGSYLVQNGGFYYLFANWDNCCDGVDSTYNIRVGRSSSITGPYLDQNGVSMASGGGTLFLESTGRFIGPGQAGLLLEAQTNWFTYHYYDGNNEGAPTLGLGQMTWSASGWPQLTNNWCAFYSFQANAQEHLGQFNGQMVNGASITNDPNRGNTLLLDGISNYVSLPLSVANASTFAIWVKWNGGADWQRVFDFGDGTNRYLYVTPANGVNGLLRFGITTNGNGHEQDIDAPIALPTNSWCHLSVVLNGVSGKLYLNGLPVATNNNVTIRPWQVQAPDNYLGLSQFPADPHFNGQLDSFRIYGVALTDAQILTLAEVHPGLANRYSFSADGADSIGAADGVLNGDALIVSNAVVLDGVPGSDVSLPGGLVSECTAASLEFWAAFGVNSNWARVFDFGATNGASGQQYLYFSPHTGANTQVLAMSTSAGSASLDVPTTLDGVTMHVVCIVDPTNNYCAIYTNGVLESAATGALPPLSGVSAALSYLGRSLFSADSWLAGAIDEFRIYDGRLSPQQIMADYQGGPNGLAMPLSLSVSASSQDVTLTWPSFAAGFVLESAPGVGPGAQWNAVTNPASISNNANWVTLPVASAPAFFRLRRADIGD